MSFLRPLYALVDWIGVRKCCVCREPIPKDKMLCPICYEAYLAERKWECGICGRPLRECLCSNAYLSKHGIKRMIKLFRYRPESEEHRLNMLLFRLKRSAYSYLLGKGACRGDKEHVAAAYKHRDNQRSAYACGKAQVRL